MKNFIQVLKKTRLFFGVTEEEIALMLNCLDAKLKQYKKGEYVCREGESISNVMVLVGGALHLQKDDYWGNRTIINHVKIGETFGEAYLSPESGVLLNDVVAVEDSAVIFFDVRRIMTVCSSACRFHSMVVQNLLFSLSEKNKKLVQKMGHVTQRTTREKLISYLSEESKKSNSPCFEIPFNRQQLADFLSVDRSAMSNELCKMRDEGLLSFNKNKFELL